MSINLTELTNNGFNECLVNQLHVMLAEAEELTYENWKISLPCALSSCIDAAACARSLACMAGQDAGSYIRNHQRGQF